MWIERVTARSFGALRDESLELRPGLNVVYGPNEAGKTTWHAAIRMALTGVRRGRGSATRETAALEDRHRPWDDRDRWAVEARIHLIDRRIDMVQDLLGKVACRATDLDLGVDVSAEITRPDGTPDASIWLGLDRESFATTLSVGQGEMLAVADSAEALQEHMQRAAAAHGTDATAAGAIERLREYRRRSVGADTTVAKGPLRSSMREMEARDEELADARRRHAAYLEQLAEAEAAAAALAEGERHLTIVRLGAAQAAAGATRQQAERAAELSARYPSPPAELAARDEVADQVAAALGGWRSRPTAAAAPGRPSALIEAELASLPPMPDGDLAPAPEVVAASREVALAEEAERAIAGDAASPVAPEHTPRWSVGRIVLIALLAVGGLAAIVSGATLVAIALIGSALAVGAWSALRAPRPSSAAPSALDRSTAARARTDAARGALADALRARDINPGDDPGRAAAAYEDACRVRAEVAARAAGAAALRHELDAVRAAEQLAADRARALAEGERALRLALAAVDPHADPRQPVATIIERLEAWRGERAALSAAAERSIREFEELTRLLDGRTAADLAADAEGAEQRAANLATAAGPNDGLIPEGMDENTAAADVERRRDAAASLAGALEVRTAELLDVASAEEAATAARDRMARVTELAEVIDQTLELLEAAQRQVHRDLAPILAAAIREWLPSLSGGTYVEAGVNPADLSIEVKERATGAWRQARLLSTGTREQIYLLLRIAMAQHLVTTAEVAPMLLDEVTAQADSDRKVAILDMLLVLAGQRQIVLFTHDDDVLTWAEGHLVGEAHGIVRLPPTATSAVQTSPVPIPVGSGT